MSEPVPPASAVESSPAEAAAFEAHTYAKVSWRLIPFIFLCYILAYLDRVNISVAKLQMFPNLKSGDEDPVFALGAGIFFIGYFFFEVPSNVILRRVGAHLWIARIMITWGIISAAFMALDPAWLSHLGLRRDWTFYGLRLLLGVAEAGFFPGIIYYLTIWYPARLRARMMAWFITAIALAGAVGNPLSGWVMDSLHGAGGLAGWQWLFLAEGVPSVVVGVAVFFFLDSSIQEARWLTAREKALLQRNIDLDNRTKTHARLRDAFLVPRVWLLCAVYFGMMIGLYGVGLWMPTIINRLISPNPAGKPSYLLVGLLSAIPYGAAAIGMTAASRSSDLTGERRWHSALAAIAGGVGLILSGVTSAHPVWSIALLSLGTAGILASLPTFWTLPTAFLAGTAAAAGIGVINSFGNLGGYVGPNITVWLKSFSKIAALPRFVRTFASNPAAPLHVIAFGMFVAALLMLLFVPRPPASVRASSAPATPNP